MICYSLILERNLIMHNENQHYFICLEYRNSQTKKYRKSYLSFDEKGLVYDVIHCYSLEQIDYFLAVFDEECILTQLRQDNALDFLNEIQSSNDIHLSIHHYDSKNGKERHSAPILKPGCFFFDIEKYLKENMTILSRKNLYNKLGGYLTNSHVTKEAKDFIQHLQNMESEFLWEEFQKLSYLDQRKIKSVIFENTSTSLLQNLQANHTPILKKDLAS